MTDKELLELAAKATGITVKFGENDYSYTTSAGLSNKWNPLIDDGDEARLEAALKLDVVWCFYTVKVGESTEYYDQHNGDRQAARRRAGTRAAAAIGAAK
jgi:hypothetical protein